MIRVLVWLTEGTWQACLEAAKEIESSEITLLYVVDEKISEAMQGAYRGLLSRHGHEPDQNLSTLTSSAVHKLFEEAKEQLGRPCLTTIRQGHVEHEVVEACADTDILICARDGGHPGPKSLGRQTRFVVDHASCTVLLAWPQ